MTPAKKFDLHTWTCTPKETSKQAHGIPYRLYKESFTTYLRFGYILYSFIINTAHYISLPLHTGTYKDTEIKAGHLQWFFAKYWKISNVKSKHRVIMLWIQLILGRKNLLKKTPRIKTQFYAVQFSLLCFVWTTIWKVTGIASGWTINCKLKNL